MNKFLSCSRKEDEEFFLCSLKLKPGVLRRRILLSVKSKPGVLRRRVLLLLSANSKPNSVLAVIYLVPRLPSGSCELLFMFRQIRRLSKRLLLLLGKDLAVSLPNCFGHRRAHNISYMLDASALAGFNVTVRTSRIASGGGYPLPFPFPLAGWVSSSDFPPST